MNAGCCPDPEGNPINPATGNKFQVEPDYIAEGPSARKCRRTHYPSMTLGRQPGVGSGGKHSYMAGIIRQHCNVSAVRLRGVTLCFKGG